jgi:hypothetical protein
MKYNTVRKTFIQSAQISFVFVRFCAKKMKTAHKMQNLSSHLRSDFKIIIISIMQTRCNRRHTKTFISKRRVFDVFRPKKSLRRYLSCHVVVVWERREKKRLWNLNYGLVGRDFAFLARHIQTKKVIYPRRPRARPLINDTFCWRCFEIKKTPFPSQNDFVAILFVALHGEKKIRKM